MLARHNYGMFQHCHTLTELHFNATDKRSMKDYVEYFSNVD